MTDKKTLVIGGSENSARYSNMAIRLLREHDIDVLSIAKRKGKVLDVEIETTFPSNEDIHTVTLYIGAQRQSEYYSLILELKPERVIFNPGTENYEFARLLEENGIVAVEACTLVMLRVGNF